MSVPSPEVVTLAVPCRTDEPALGRTLAAALASWRGAAAGRRLEVLVCLNGAPRREPGAAVRAVAAAAGAAATVVDVDGPLPGGLPLSSAALSMVALITAQAGKPHAWNVLRRLARGAVVLFMDADVSFAPDAFGRLLDALATHPRAVLASGKTTCAARPGLFEAIMAAPYGVDFPNLSPQLYAARLAALPPAFAEDLLEPEHWLELTVGHAAIVRCPDVPVIVRLPGTFADFFRQRVRIEMGKVQISRQYPALQRRGAVRPGPATVLRSLGWSGSGRLAVYVALRTVAHALAWWRYQRAGTAGIWRQAATTKQWDAA